MSLHALITIHLKDVRAGVTTVHDGTDQTEERGLGVEIHAASSMGTDHRARIRSISSLISTATRVAK